MKRIKLVVFFILGLFMLTSCGSLNHESFPNGPQIEEPGTNTDGEASSYLLTYYENGLKVYQEKIESGKELPQVDATKIPLGYEFIGWSTSEEEYLVVDFNIMPEEDVDLFAHYKKCKYSINFEANIELPVGTTTSIEYEYQDRLGSYIPNDLQEVIDQQTEFVFVGWFLDPLFKEEFVEVSMPAHDLTLYAKWQFSGVCFVNGLEVFYEVKGDEGQLINAPVQNPTKPGYDFVGWKDEEGNLVQFPLTITDEVQYIYASYEPKSNVSYKVEHYLENLNGSFVRFEVEDLKASTDQEVEALWKSYTGFTKDEQNENNVLKGNVNYNGSLVLKLYYTRNSYEVSFNTNGGSVIDTVSYKYEQAIAAPSSPNKVGYTFAGWQLNGKDYNFATMPANDIELTAKWQIVEYTVTFVATEVVGKVTYTVENKNIVEPTVPSIEHFTGAWADYELTTGNITVNAVYTPVTYTVTFKAEGEVVDTEEYTVVNPTIAKPQVPAKEHYTGVWELYVLAGGDKVVNAVYTPVTYYVTFKADGEEVAKLPYNVENTAVVNPTVPAKQHYTGAWEAYTLTSGNVEVEAEYTPVTYYVTFIANGVEVAKLPYNVEYTTVVNPVVPAKQHYTGTWETYTLTSGNVEVEAEYTPVTYYVTFIAEGNEVAKLSYTVENTSIVEPQVPSKTGYTGTWEAYTLTSGNVDVKAIYTINQYKVTFKNGNDVLSEEILDYGTIINAIADPTKEGYEFIGWSVDLPITVPANNLVIEAEWKSWTYTYTFGANGSASHYDGTAISAPKSYSSTEDSKTNITFTSLSKVYGGARDAKGNSALKLGTSSAAGSFTFTVPEDVQYVVIKVAKYKANAATITVNSVKYTIDTASNDGEYTSIIIDTTSTKTINLKVSSGYRCMIDEIFMSRKELQKATISFQSNGGIGSVSNIEDVLDSKIELPSWDGLTAPANKIFDSWNTASDGSGISYQAGDVVTLTEDLVLYAIWIDNPPVELTIKEAKEQQDGFNVILSGVVQSIDTAWNLTHKNITVTIKDETDTIQLYRLATNVNVGDLITVTGVMDTYNGIRQIAAGATAVINGVLEITVSYNANGGSGSIVPMSIIAGQNIDLADGAILTAPVGKEFKGWSLDQNATNPTFGSGDVTTFFENTTLYAIWGDVGSSEPTWQLVTDVTTLQAGDQIVIAAKSANYALSTNQKSNNRGQASVTKTGNSITFGSDVQILTLKAGSISGTFAFYTGAGYLYAASSSSNYLRTQNKLDANASWAITITSAGVATIKAQGSNTRNLLRYNSQSSLFACYGSGQQDVCIYKLTN